MMYIYKYKYITDICGYKNLKQVNTYKLILKNLKSLNSLEF